MKQKEAKHEQANLAEIKYTNIDFQNLCLQILTKQTQSNQITNQFVEDKNIFDNLLFLIEQSLEISKKWKNVFIKSAFNHEGLEQFDTSVTESISPLTTISNTQNSSPVLPQLPSQKEKKRS